MDSKAHIDDLVLEAKDVEKAEQNVANLIDTFNQWNGKTSKCILRRTK